MVTANSRGWPARAGAKLPSSCWRSALTQGLLAAGVLAALAMSVGTAITVSVLAGLSVALRRGALTLTSTSNRWQTIAANTLGIAGAAVVTLFGVTFFAAAL